MTDTEKKLVKEGVIAIFDNFNILEHTTSLGGLRDDILRLINSMPEEPNPETLGAHLSNEGYVKWTANALLNYAKHELEKQGEPTDIPADAVLDGNKDGLIADTIRYKREKQGKKKSAEEYNITGIGSKNAQGKLGEMIKKLKSVNEVFLRVF